VCFIWLFVLFKTLVQICKIIVNHDLIFFSNKINHTAIKYMLFLYKKWIKQIV
jgi:hypothetical protein